MAAVPMKLPGWMSFNAISTTSVMAMSAGRTSLLNTQERTLVATARDVPHNAADAIAHVEACMDLGPFAATLQHGFPAALSGALVVYLKKSTSTTGVAAPALALTVMRAAFAGCALATVLLLAIWFAAPRAIFRIAEAPLVLLPAIAAAVAVRRKHWHVAGKRER